MKTTKRTLVKTTTLAVIAWTLASPISWAAKGRPNFEPALWADSQLWSSKATTPLPAPNAHNRHAYDALFVILNSNNPAGQLPVAEAAPGNVDFNGGRWAVYSAWWTALGFAEHGTVPVISSYAELMIHALLGHLDFELGPPEGGPPPYFQCPLLPVKN